MSWFKAIGNLFTTRHIEDRLHDLRTVHLATKEAHEALKADYAALQAENLALKQQVAEIQQSQASAPLPYKSLRPKPEH